MRPALLCTLACAAASACKEQLFAPRDVLIERTYQLVGCRPTFQSSSDQPPPCTSYSTPSTHSTADSGRLVLRRDGTASWMLGSTSAFNPCYVSGASCPTTSKHVDAAAATYRIANDSIVVHLATVGSSGDTDLFFLGVIPDEVPRDWAGPAMLTYSLSNGAYLGVFKP
ncbi:MAG: hypothetical protein ABR579_04585 [Actinomycetota bacterium]